VRCLSPDLWGRKGNYRAFAAAIQAFIFSLGICCHSSSAEPVADVVPPQSPAALSAVFVAYNVRNYSIHAPQNSRGSLKSEAAREAVAEVLASVNPSMVGLAEVACEESLIDLQGRLARRGVVLPHTFLLCGPDADRRLAFMSMFPILENHSREHVPFELGGRPQAMQRGLLDLSVGLPEGAPLRIVGLHLKSKREVPEFDQEALRSREAREVRKHIDGILGDNPGIPLLVWGDFNMLKNDSSWRIIVGNAGLPQALQAVDATDAHGLNWTHHWEAADLYSRIDFILVNPTVAGMIDAGSAKVVDHNLGFLASDHRPLAITLSRE